MTINFRRNALQLSVAALFSSAFMANAADVPQVKVTVTDKQCEPMTITVNAGKTQFIIQNHSQKALEWEILKGVMVVEERENIALALARNDGEFTAWRIRYDLRSAD
ncbi:inactive ferrous ion transporter periplasmic protein EfeO [Escherichia coli]|nr:inactive ferrous ion transporter periplasmic protein EfeO [Escherichia coli]